MPKSMAKLITCRYTHVTLVSIQPLQLFTFNLQRHKSVLISTDIVNVKTCITPAWATKNTDHWTLWSGDWIPPGTRSFSGVISSRFPVPITMNCVKGAPVCDVLTLFFIYGQKLELKSKQWKYWTKGLP